VLGRGCLVSSRASVVGPALQRLELGVVVRRRLPRLFHARMRHVRLPRIGRLLLWLYRHLTGGSRIVGLDHATNEATAVPVRGFSHYARHRGRVHSTPRAIGRRAHAPHERHKRGIPQRHTLSPLFPDRCIGNDLEHCHGLERRFRVRLIGPATSIPMAPALQSDVFGTADSSACPTPPASRTRRPHSPDDARRPMKGKR
jgi:hypothetical protein